jgi:hypothetical protein
MELFSTYYIFNPSYEPRRITEVRFLVFNANVFRFGKEVECFPTTFSTNSTVFYSPKWSSEIP